MPHLGGKTQTRRPGVAPQRPMPIQAAARPVPAHRQEKPLPHSLRLRTTPPSLPPSLPWLRLSLVLTSPPHSCHNCCLAHPPIRSLAYFTPKSLHRFSPGWPELTHSALVQGWHLRRLAQIAKWARPPGLPQPGSLVYPDSLCSTRTGTTFCLRALCEASQEEVDRSKLKASLRPGCKFDPPGGGSREYYGSLLLRKST